MPSADRAFRAQSARGIPLALLGSLALHLGVYALLRWSSTMPEVDFDLALPSEVQFGLTEQQEVAAVEPPAPPPEPAPVAAAETPVAEAPKPKPKRKKREEPDGGVQDASTPDGGSDDAGRPLEVAQTPNANDAGVAGGTAQAPALAAFAPKGAQIALRVDIGRVRDSELAPDVRAVLSALPDWQLILEGSGIDPLTDLQRLYLATPDLKREHVVIAGQYVGKSDLPQRAVASLAQARGVSARWRTRGGIAVAPWPNADDTARVVALIAPQQFAITRPDDLPRVLLVARALAARRAEQGKIEVDAGEALLALNEGETLALSVEGVRVFARGNLRGVPERFEASVIQRDDGSYALHSVGHFEDEDSAEQAREYWLRVRDQYSRHPLVALIGMHAPIADAKLERVQTRLEIDTRVTLQQARVVLGFVIQAIGGRRSPAPGAAPGVTPGGSGSVAPGRLPLLPSQPAPRPGLSPRGP